MKESKIIEINGVKLEIDLRSAKRVDQIRVGDRVKVRVWSKDGASRLLTFKRVSSFEDCYCEQRR